MVEIMDFDCLGILIGFNFMVVSFFMFVSYICRDLMMCFSESQRMFLILSLAFFGVGAIGFFLNCIFIFDVFITNVWYE